MVTTTKQRIEDLKEASQDFEWYPTTNEMIHAVGSKIYKDTESILDIGAGDGRVLEGLDRIYWKRWRDASETEYTSCIKKFAIEKSAIHNQNMPADIAIIGTDFYKQTLIDKKVDVIFCNPPYSDFESWVTTIITEANAKRLYLIMPSRWKDSQPIERAMKRREVVGRVIYSGDFLEADRAARATVDIVEITINTRVSQKSDPFNIWFEEHFSGLSEPEATYITKEAEDARRAETIAGEMVQGRNMVDVLCGLYDRELAGLLANYRSLSEIPISLLRELGVSSNEIMDALKTKIEGLKNRYWKELFTNLDKINQRLTSKSREKIYQKMTSAGNVDFTTDNAYAVVMWVLKNANSYIDAQLVTIFKDLTEPKCVTNYKSNQKTWEKNGWRYCKDDHSHYKLDYRIVSQRHAAIQDNSDYATYNYTKNLHKDCHKFIDDAITIANNLGFSCSERSEDYEWLSNKSVNFHEDNGEILMQVKAFKNGNIHMKFKQDFIKALNIEASRLLGWVTSPEEAAEEMGLNLNFVLSRYQSNIQITTQDCGRLLTAG